MASVRAAILSGHCQLASTARATMPPSTPVNPWLLTLFVLLQAGRLWVIASLGRRWTTRIIIMPETPLVRRGPYRWLGHPNYLVVAGELAVLPLALGQGGLALLFTLLNIPLTLHRIRVEEAALRPPILRNHRPTGTAR